jgi:dTDP-4-dehydrorhamnose reductase
MMGKEILKTEPMILLGATSITGWNLYRSYPQKIIPFCNPHNKAETLGEMRRIRLDNPDDMLVLFQDYPANTIIYCDAICDVSACEANPSWAHHVNVECLQYFLNRMPKGNRLVYVSSDHVFGEDGSYDESSPVCPISVYGQTRVKAEELVRKCENSLIIRAGLVLGPSVDGKTGHIDWLRYRHKNSLPVTIIDDEARSVVWAHELAAQIMALATSHITGVRHISAPPTNRVHLARKLLKEMDLLLDFNVRSRRQQSYPHLGKIELKTLF